MISNDLSLNRAAVYSFYSVHCMKERKEAKERPGNGHFKMIGYMIGNHLDR